MKFNIFIGADGKNAHLMKLEKAADKLQLFKASLQDYDSLLAAIKGCSGVFHVACPVPSGTVANPQTELVEPAVVGTRNVLRACSEAGVKRLIVVSSVAAAMNPNWPKNRPMDENCWTDIDYCMTIQDSFNWYSIAKTVSESEALKYSEKSEFDVITLCPSFILGPLLQPTMNASNILFNELFKGPEAIENRARVIVDVRDVAEALLLVYEKPEASGRYICAPHPIRIRDMVAMLKTKYPNYNYPKRYIEVGEDHLKFSSEKLKRLGWNYKPLEDTLVDTIDQFQEAVAANGKNAHLMKLDKAGDKLQLFKASLQDYDTLLAAIKGCSGVFHVAYPVPTGTVTNPQTELVEPAVAGTQNVLRACSEAGVKRLIAVSSIAAVVMNPNWPQDKPMDENCWTDIDYCKSRQGWLEWYSVAKMVSESYALKYSEKSELDVITVCPPFILGPSLQPTMTSSNVIFNDILKGRVESTSRILDLCCVDVRDVAEALLLVYENPEASGRYICAPHPIRVRDMVAMLKTKYPNFNHPKSYAEVGNHLKFNSEKLKRLGWNCKSLEDTLAETIEQYQEAGILNKY